MSPSTREDQAIPQTQESAPAHPVQNSEKPEEADSLKVVNSKERAEGVGSKKDHEEAESNDEADSKRDNKEADSKKSHEEAESNEVGADSKKESDSKRGAESSVKSSVKRLVHSLWAMYICTGSLYICHEHNSWQECRVILA